MNCPHLWYQSGDIIFFFGEMCAGFLLVVSFSFLIFRPSLPSRSPLIPHTEPLCVSFSLPSTRCRVQKSATANFVSLVSLYGDQRRGPALLALWARRVHRQPSPLIVRFHIWKWVQQKPQERKGRAVRERERKGMAANFLHPETRFAPGCLLNIG